jgi:hypothetical protein
MKHIKFTTTVVLFCLLFPSLSFAFQQKEVLRGLKGVKVVVSYIRPEIEKFGLTKSMIKKSVEMKLKNLGIKVNKKAKPPAMSTFIVNVNAIYVKPKSAISYSIGINLVEWVYLKREMRTIGDLMEARATTWYNGKVGFVETSSVKIILKKVEELVEKFVYDYLAVNPS